MTEARAKNAGLSETAKKVVEDAEDDSAGFWNNDPDDEEGEEEVLDSPIMYRFQDSSGILDILRSIPRKYDFKIKQLVDIKL